MKYNALGKTGPEVSAVSFGTSPPGVRDGDRPAGQGVVDVEPLTSAVRDIDAGPAAFAEMRQAADLVKVLLRPNA